MPITSSAKKALRQSTRRREHNLARKKILKTAIKQLKKLVAEKNFEDAKTHLPKVYKALDKSAKTNLIKKNTASRLKSKLTHFLNKSLNTAY